MKLNKLNDIRKFCRKLFPTCQVRVVRFYVSCLLLSSPLLSSPLLSSPLLSSPLLSSPLLSSPLLSSPLLSSPLLSSPLLSSPLLSSPLLSSPLLSSPLLSSPLLSSPLLSSPLLSSLPVFLLSSSLPTAMMCAQCSVPDLNRDRGSSVFRAGPQPRSCEFSVPRRTSTAIL